MRMHTKLVKNEKIQVNGWNSDRHQSNTILECIEIHPEIHMEIHIEMHIEIYFKSDFNWSIIKSINNKLTNDTSNMGAS